MSPNQKLEICKQTRKIASDTLKQTLQELLSKNDPISEKSFANQWLGNLRKHTQIFPDGWYIPPPFGIGVLFSAETDSRRTSYESLRFEKNWPREDVFLDKEKGLAYFYASPVNKDLGIIGDFGLTVYFGKDEKVRDFFRLCYEITLKVFDFAKVGMSFSDIAKYCAKLLEGNNLQNTIVSSSDSTGTNIGHTIPGIDEDFTEEELQIFKAGDWEEVCKMISQKRLFLNRSEQATVKPGMAITFEPRPISAVNPDLPMVGFHTIGLFYEDGSKELLNEFEEIFKLVGMDYLL